MDAVAALEVPVVYACGFAGLMALVVAARPPRWSAVEAWASRPGGGALAEVQTSQVRGLLTRTCLITLVVFVIALLPALALQLKAAAPAWALGLAVLLGAAAGVDGGPTRRVDLSQLSGRSQPRRRVMQLACTAVALTVLAAGWWWAIDVRYDVGWPGTGPDTAMPDSERWTLLVTAGCSLMTGLALVFTDRRIRLRRALPGVDAAVDAALREVSRRRALLGAGAALLTQLAVLVSLSPLLTVAVGAPQVLDPSIGQLAGLVGTAVVGAAMAAVATGLLRWSSQIGNATGSDISARTEV